MADLETAEQIRERRRQRREEMVEIPGFGYIGVEAYERLTIKDHPATRPVRVPIEPLKGGFRDGRET